MHNLIRINKSLTTPIYQQIVLGVISRIRDGTLRIGDQLPSINQIAGEFGLARETVVKAFRQLQEKAIIRAIHGKGFFINSQNLDLAHRIFLFFDTLSAYKEVMYQAIKDTFGDKAFIDIYFHHFNPTVFEDTIREHAGDYTSYIVLPFDHPLINEMMSPIPKEKLYLLDRFPKYYKSEYKGVCQDFKRDVYESLISVKHRALKYNKIILAFRDAVTDPPHELAEGFQEFCEEFQIQYEITRAALSGRKIKKGEAFLVIDDEDLVYVVENAKNLNLGIGENVGIISYNETSLKKVVGGGISVISTDFGGMGRKVAGMILANEKQCIYNPCKFIDRGSF
ncbi:MAG: GntR family transcriptional regulator [Chlorobi bacterium]|nr:GntR family transcriptional regulator [Chlorobiota bacterium]